MQEYDPLVAPDPTVWLALDETERLSLVKDYHAKQRVEPPSGPDIHAVAHVVVENQIAEGEALPVREKARQLMAQGLNRHDAIHAIGSVLMKHIHTISQRGMTDQDPTRVYFSALRRMNARKWLRSG